MHQVFFYLRRGYVAIMALVIFASVSSVGAQDDPTYTDIVTGATTVLSIPIIIAVVGAVGVSVAAMWMIRAASKAGR